jgi:hypothetical protein
VEVGRNSQAETYISQVSIFGLWKTNVFSVVISTRAPGLLGIGQTLSLWLPGVKLCGRRSFKETSEIGDGYSPINYFKTRRVNSKSIILFSFFKL